MSRGKQGKGGDLPNPLEKREVLYSRGTEPAVLVTLGERFLAEGYPLDALNFFTEARSIPSLEQMHRQAREEGDAFLVEQTARALGRELSPEEWAAIAETARKLGKEAFARTALRKAGLDTEAPIPPGAPVSNTAVTATWDAPPPKPGSEG